MFILGLLEYILTIFKVEFKIWIFAFSTIGYYGGGGPETFRPHVQGVILWTNSKSSAVTFLVKHWPPPYVKKDSSERCIYHPSLVWKALDVNVGFTMFCLT